MQAVIQDSSDERTDWGQRLIEVTTLKEAWSHLEGGKLLDLVNSRWGHGLYQGEPNGVELLRRVSARRATGLRVAPVIIFAGFDHYTDNRPSAHLAWARESSSAGGRT